MKYTVWLTPRQLAYLKDKSLKMHVTRVNEDLIETEVTIRDKYDLLLFYAGAKEDGMQEGLSYTSNAF